MNKKLILFGEQHGTKKIPKLLLRFFKDLSKEEDFNVCFEIPKEFQDKIEDFFKQDEGGLNTKEYARLVNQLKKLGIKIFCIDSSDYSSINKREKTIAKNIYRVVDKKTFVIMGNIHSCMKKFSLWEKEIIPAGFLLSKKFKDIISIDLSENYNFINKKNN